MKIKKVIKMLIKQGPFAVLRAARDHYRKKRAEEEFRNRARSLHLISESEREKQKNRKFLTPVTFSIITPLYNTPENYLKELLESLQKQTYPNWQLCLADGSDKEHGYVGEICREYASKDSRICYEVLEENKGISENTNECLKFATGDYIGLLDHDDILHESALYEMMKVIEDEKADFLYSDEVKFSGKIEDATDFNFKPGFGKDELRAHNYICHFTVFKKSLLDQIGQAYRPEFDGSQDHDMVLRLTEKAEKIVHIPKVLYYWRVHPQSVSMNLDSKSYAVDAAIHAVSEQLERVKEPGKVESNLPYRTIYRIHYEIPDNAGVLIILHGAKTEMEYDTAKKKILEKTSYKNIRIVYMDAENGTFADDVNRQISSMEEEYAVMMDIHCLPVNQDWVEEMLMFAQRKDVCAVSPKVYFENNLIAYAGIALDDRDKAKVKFLCQGINGAKQGYEAMLRHVRNTTAAWKGCCMVSKSAWKSIGGLSTDVPGYEMIDYCLKGEKQGLWTVWTCFAEFSYSKALAIEIDDTEIQKFISKWENRISQKDNFYNQNLAELGIL